MDAAYQIARHGSAGRRRLVPLVLAGALALGACAQNPFDILVKHVDQPIPGADQPTPNLASVPNQAPSVTPKDERAAIAQSLEADNRYPGAAPPLLTSAPISAPPPIPAPPAELPPGFATAQAPVKVPEAAPQPNVSEPDTSAAPDATQGATLTPGAPSFGAMGRPDRVAIVLFAPGSAAIDRDQIELLKPLVRRLRAQGGTLQVVGYASTVPDTRDPTKVKITTFDLSLKRAQAVALALGRLGVGTGEVIVSAEGDSAPVVEIDGISGAAANERVDIYLEN